MIAGHTLSHPKGLGVPRGAKMSSSSTRAGKPGATWNDCYAHVSGTGATGMTATHTTGCHRRCKERCWGGRVGCSEGREGRTFSF